MTPPPGPERSVASRVADVLFHPSRHVGAIAGAAYLSALAGLATSLWSGLDGAGNGFPVVGLALLALSFALLFACSLLVLNPGRGDRRS